MATLTEKPKHPLWKTTQPFVVGGIGGCFATCCIQPIDMVKVRMQLLGEVAYASSAADTKAIKSRSPIDVVKFIAKNEGFLSFYKGLDAGLLRQATYSTCRFGFFRYLSNMLAKPDKPGDPPKKLPLYKKAAASLIGGGLASLVGNPADVALVRLQADATLPLSERRNYTGLFNALSRIIKDEGLFTLWRGATPTVLRAMMLNTGMLATFDHSKELLEPHLGTGWQLTFAASTIAGFFAATLSLPCDFLKTRMQRMKADPVTGLNPYKNVLDCAIKVYKAEGILRFYTGYVVYYFRVAPHAMITLAAVEVLTKALNKFL